ncbi:MAG: long-chain-fatty-acid--CoA ligase [Dehalococcoidia bacterium]|nr:MAG: long-chain-fatty-acid--CoA ligase [Dehalococcoidia bacterium]
MNTTEFLMITSSIVPDRAAITFEGKKFLYADLSDRSNRLANALAEFGVQKGDMVAALQVNCNEFVETYFAVAKLGAIFVPLNFRAKSDELSYMISNCEAKALFVGERYVDMVNAMRAELPQTKHFICYESKPESMVNYDEVLAAASPEEVFTEIDDDDITILMYTAGTTGRPKGVPLTHNSFSTYVMNNVTPVDIEIEETNILTVPLYHVAGIQAVMAAIYGGRTLAMMRQFEVKEWMNTVQQERANRAMLVPTMLKRVIDEPDFEKYDLSSLRVITYGAAPMPFEVIKKAIALFPGVMFINAFGQTETASTITTLGPEDHIIEGTEEEKAKKLKRLQSSIGRPMDDVEIKIVDDDGNELPTGEVGEILARGPRVMSGYWKDAEKTAKAITTDGWLRTSDKGYVDEEGYIYLAGRGDDMIIRGGENISPEEVEDVLYAHPKVEEAAVIGVADPEWGQEPKAIVVLKKGETATPEEIMEFCRERLSSFKRPRYVAFVDELPRTSTGKVLKRDLRAQYGEPKND